MKVAFVVPRYGLSVIGGAETAARLLAEHLAVLCGWEIDVLTTCAQDFVTWEDVVPPGSEVVNGVRVHRFRSVAGRADSFHPFSASLLSRPEQASDEEGNRWIDLQGPRCPEVVEAASTWDGDAIVFYPYLYYPTVRAIARTRAPAVLHPAAHDEPALRLSVFGPVFAAPAGLVFQTAAERSLVESRFPVGARSQLLLGLGVDDPDLVRGPAPEPGPVPCPDVPFVLCLGRVDRHKGSMLLRSLFATYKERNPGPLRLVLAGPVVEAPPGHPEIDVVGPVSDRAKWDLLRGASVLVSPSAFEAFSLVVAEAWSARIPVLVNAACAPTVEQCRRSKGGLTFGSYLEFEVALRRLTAQPDLAATLGANGRAYVDRRFRWPVVIDRYRTFLETVATVRRR